MATQQPSQYQIDNMQPGDIVYVRKPKLLYRLYRKLFMNSPKIKVKKFLNDTCDEYNVYYQEDCTLLYNYEVSCVQKYDNEVPVAIGLKEGSKIVTTQTLKSLQVGLYNALLVFQNGLSITIPVDYLNNAMRKNAQTIKQLDDQRMIDDLLKFQRYKGNYFKSYVEKYNIKSWTAAYCSVCGQPVTFDFTPDKVIINNNCTCGELKLDKPEFTYDELAIWYYNQTSPSVKKVYDEFWFKKEV